MNDRASDIVNALFVNAIIFAPTAAALAPEHDMIAIPSLLP
jgi:hypothetical protein